MSKETQFDFASWEPPRDYLYIEEKQSPKGLRDTIVEEVDILKTTETLSERVRKEAIKGMTEEQILSYDLGANNTLNCLKSLIFNEARKEENLLIYQKNGKSRNVRRYRKLSDVLKEADNEAVVD